MQVSLRLECMQLTDAEAGLLAAWAARNSDLISVRKLWCDALANLFKYRMVVHPHPQIQQHNEMLDL